MEKKEHLSAIMKANGEMLKYFSLMHADAMSDLQDIKTELFELNIRLDELNRTKNLYSMNNNHTKNVFSPIQPDDSITQKETELEENLRILTEKKNQLETRQQNAQEKIQESEERLRLLRNAQMSAIRISKDPTFIDEPEDDPFEYIEEEEPTNEIRVHGERILLLDAFDKTYLSTILDKRILTPLSSQSHRLQTLKRMIATDPEQAKLMLDEFDSQIRGISETLRSQLERLHRNFDEKSPLSTLLDEWIMAFRDKHPEYVLDSSVQVRDETMVLPYTYSLTLLQLMDYLFDNIVRHSSANQIRFRVQVNASVIDVFLSDNGTGIPDHIMDTAPWYSSLHKAEEMLFLLDGHMQISGSKDHGTTVRFTLPF